MKKKRITKDLPNLTPEQIELAKAPVYVAPPSAYLALDKLKLALEHEDAPEKVEQWLLKYGYPPDYAVEFVNCYKAILSFEKAWAEKHPCPSPFDMLREYFGEPTEDGS